MNNRINRRISFLLVNILLMIFLCGCSLKTTTASEEDALLLVDSPATTLDNVWYNPGGIFRCAVFESLLLVDADRKELHCALAKDYKVSEDGLVYTFILRKDVTWHDGEAFDAEDVVFSIKAALRSDEINGIFKAAFQNIEGEEAYRSGKSNEVTGIAAEDNVLTISLTSPIGDFLDAMAQFAVLPEHLLGDVEPKALPQSDFWKKPVGCGRYQVSKLEDETFYLEAYSDYYGKKPGIKKIQLALNEENPVEALREGRLDFYVSNDPEEIAQLKGVETCSEHHLNIMFPTYLILNLSQDEGVNESLKDVRVREALLLAIDRETIIDAVFPGSSVTNTLVPTWDKWYLESAKEYHYDPEKAKALLEEAGFDFSKEIRLRYSVKGTSTADLMNAIAVYWKAVGIQVDLAKFEGSGSEHMFNIRDYDICYKRLSAFDHVAIYSEVQGEGIMQTALYNQPVYDEYIAQLGITQQDSQRMELVKQMQQLDQQYLLRIPLFSLANIAYVNDAHFNMPDAYGNLWYRYDLKFEKWKLVNK